MSFSERLAKLDRLQKTRGFKIAATIVVAALCVAAAAAYAVVVTGPARERIDDRYAFLDQFPADGAAPTPGAEADAEFERSAEETDELASGADERRIEETRAQQRSAVIQAQEITANLLRARLNPWNIVLAAFAVGTVVIAAIWLGLGLTYLAVNVGLAIFVVPLASFGATRDAAILIGGAGQLALAFATLLRVGAASLSASHPVTAVARTVLSEAVRMKLSGVFIVLLVFGLAGLPTLLDSQEELRYRVQSFLQYALGGTYVLVALLTLFFSVATVAFEQRDKIIWQTVTKPVSAWQYILGKWLGIMTLNACLLGVCGAGIFLFTEYLRAQPAVGERTMYDAGETGAISTDRLSLETRVLVARRVVVPEPPILADDPEFLDAAQQQIEQFRLADPGFAPTRANEVEAIAQLYEDLRRQSRVVPPGEIREFRFPGLGDAVGDRGVIQMRFAIDAGTNRPDETLRLTFLFPNQAPIVREAALGFGQFITIGPWTVNPEDGALSVAVFNGDIQTGERNPTSVTFPDDGFEVSYAVGGFRGNFLRVVVVLWVKLGFLAMVGIFTGTFLSFPVAGLMTFVLAFAAEGAAYITSSVQTYQIKTTQGELMHFNYVIAMVAEGVATVFLPYAEMKPMNRLVDGLELPWIDAAAGAGVIVGWTTLLFGLAIFAMKRRELATYSGH
ncbi:MAG: hypothetical protein AAGB51_12235 [Planctomycetota bacterium]